MTQEEILERYRDDRIDFKDCVCQIVKLDMMRPREAYQLVRVEEEAKMQRIALRARAIAETDRRRWGE